VSDPWLSYFGHPLLPAGYNSAAINGDEFDGAGVNERISPVLFDTFIGLEILIITADMLEVFEGCADLIIASQNNVINFPEEVRTVEIRKRA
jgi:hypothetical protein